MAELKIVEHEILGRLKQTGLIILASGSDAEGFTPIDKFLVETAYLHYGTLVYLLNIDPENIEPPSSSPIFWNKIKKKREEITIRIFGWEDISDAIQNLTYHGDVADDANKDSGEIENRIIRLTAKGAASFISKIYLKEAAIDKRTEEAAIYTRQSAKYTEQVAKSTIDANRWLKRISVLTAFFTLVLALTGVLQYRKSDIITIKDWNKLTEKIDSIKTNGIKDTVIIIQRTARNRVKK